MEDVSGPPDPEDMEEHQYHGRMSIKVFFWYILAGTSKFGFIGLALVFVIAQMSITMADYFSSFWYVWYGKY